MAKHKRLNLSQTLNLQYAKEQKLTHMKDVPTLEIFYLDYCLKFCPLCRSILTFKNNVNLLPFVSRGLRSILTHPKQLRGVQIKYYCSLAFYQQYLHFCHVASTSTSKLVINNLQHV